MDSSSLQSDQVNIEEFVPEILDINIKLTKVTKEIRDTASKFFFVLIIFIIIICTLLIFTIGSNLYNLITWHSVKEDSNLSESEQRYLYISFIIGIICSSLALIFNVFILLFFWYCWKKQKKGESS